jgi:hypothetical protein
MKILFPWCRECDLPGGECVLIKGRFDWQKYCDLSDGHFLAQYLCVAQISVSLPGLNAERLVLVSTTASIKSLNSSVRCPNPSCLASHPLFLLRDFLI